jgi:hypothetical protein
MLFLIEYDRRNGRLVSFRSFDDSERQASQEARLELELIVNEGMLEHEIVVLEAASEEALRRTHRRYFEDLKELLSTP